MEKVNRYRKIVRKVLSDYVKDGEKYPDKHGIETRLFSDLKNDHYHVMRIGWRNDERIYLVIFHIDVKDGKIWVQQNVSDYDIVGDIEALGVPKKDIVLAFHVPFMRPYTEYAVA